MYGIGTFAFAGPGGGFPVVTGCEASCIVGLGVMTMVRMVRMVVLGAAKANGTVQNPNERVGRPFFLQTWWWWCFISLFLHPGAVIKVINCGRLPLPSNEEKSLADVLFERSGLRAHHAHSSTATNHRHMTEAQPLLNLVFFFLPFLFPLPIQTDEQT
jgi:hypothetical protein